MRRSLCSLACAGLVFTVALVGCSSKPVLRDKPPPDPLLTSKKPVEGKVYPGEAPPPATDEFAPPPRPVLEDDVRPVRVLGLRPVGETPR
jgi:hypothetical protein